MSFSIMRPLAFCLCFFLWSKVYHKIGKSTAALVKKSNLMLYLAAKISIIISRFLKDTQVRTNIDSGGVKWQEKYQAVPSSVKADNLSHLYI